MDDRKALEVELKRKMKMYEEADRLASQTAAQAANLGFEVEALEHRLEATDEQG